MSCWFCIPSDFQLVHDPFICCVIPCIVDWICKNHYNNDLELVLHYAEITMGNKSGEMLHEYCILWRIYREENIRYILNHISKSRFKQ